MCIKCPSGSWSNGKDGICHLCKVGFWSEIEGRKEECTEICDDDYFCPPGSTHPRMFYLPQGNELPVLGYEFWIGTLLCVLGAQTTLLFRIC